MPVKTRSQARSVQSTDLVSSPRVNSPRLIPGTPPGLINGSLQGNAVVTGSINEGAPLESVANGNHELEFECFNINNKKFRIKKCGNKKCKTCSDLVISDKYFSNHSRHTYKIINHTEEDLSCKSKNLVYLLTCRCCNIQYVGETLQPIHMRMNTHRNSKTGCERIIHHKNTCSNNNFSFDIQIIIKLKGDGKDEHGRTKKDTLEERLKWEDDAIKRLRTIYPYGLNEKAKNKITCLTILEILALYFPLSHVVVNQKGVREKTEKIEGKF